jgi:hypothetical protein
MKNSNLRKTEHPITEKFDVLREITWKAHSISTNMRHFGGQIEMHLGDELSEPAIQKKRFKWLKNFQAQMVKAEKEHFDLFLKRR